MIFAMLTKKSNRIRGEMHWLKRGLGGIKGLPHVFSCCVALHITTHRTIKTDWYSHARGRI